MHLPNTDALTGAPTETLSLRQFHWILLAITLAALVPRVVLGLSESITYDGYWHVLTATQDRWANMVLDYKLDAHPLLYYICLRWVSYLGHLPIVYRSISILPGVASAFLIGKIAEKIYSSRVVALLAAAAFGFASTSLELSIDVRSYPGCLFFVLLSFYFFLQALALPEDSRGARAWIWLGVFASVAIGFEYYAMFYLAACVGFFFLEIVFHSAYRRKFWLWVRSHPIPPLAALAIPLYTIRYFYRTHLVHQPPMFSHISEYYWYPGSDESAGNFVLKNLKHTLAYFVPVSTANPALFWVLLIIFVALLLLCLRKEDSAGDPLACRALVLMPSLLLAQLAILGLAQRYPFGGQMRQMSIVAPFLCLCVFLVLDRGVALFSSPRYGAIALAAVGVATVASALFAWITFPRQPNDLFSDEYQRFSKSIPAPQAVYLDTFDTVGYFIHTHRWTWRSEERVRFNAQLQKYDIFGPDGQRLVIIRDRVNWNPDFGKVSAYDAIERALHDFNLSSLSLFHVQQGGVPFALGNAEEQWEIVHRLAKEAGLKVTALDVHNEDLFATFELDD